jgi:hypothetical protein
MKKKISIFTISFVALLGLASTSFANEKSGLRLYHVKINKFELKATCMEHFPTGKLIQQSSSIYKKIQMDSNDYIIQYTSMGDCFLNEYR